MFNELTRTEMSILSDMLYKASWNADYPLAGELADISDELDRLSRH